MKPTKLDTEAEMRAFVSSEFFASVSKAHPFKVALEAELWDFTEPLLAITWKSSLDDKRQLGMTATIPVNHPDPLFQNRLSQQARDLAEHCLISIDAGKLVKWCF